MEGIRAVGTALPAPACARNGRRRLINMKFERRPQVAARAKVMESLRCFSDTLERRAPLHPEARKLQRQRVRQVLVRSMSGEEKYFDLPRWPEKPMKQLEFFQCVRRAFNIPSHPTSVSICLLFIGRQQGASVERERWLENQDLECYSHGTVPEALRGTIWQLVKHY